MLHKVKVAAAVAVAALVGYVLANVLIPEPNPYDQMAEAAAEHCEVEVDGGTANQNVLARIPSNRGLDWYWYGTRFEAEGGYVAVYELENRVEGWSDPSGTRVYCPDQTNGWSKRG